MCRCVAACLPCQDFAFPLVGYKDGEGWRDITKDEVTVVAYGPQGLDMLMKHLGATREPPAIDKAIIIGCGVTLLVRTGRALHCTALAVRRHAFIDCVSVLVLWGVCVCVFSYV